MPLPRERLYLSNFLSFASPLGEASEPLRAGEGSIIKSFRTVSPNNFKPSSRACETRFRVAKRVAAVVSMIRTRARDIMRYPPNSGRQRSRNKFGMTGFWVCAGILPPHPNFKENLCLSQGRGYISQTFCLLPLPWERPASPCARVRGL